MKSVVAFANGTLQNVDGKIVIIATIYPGTQRPYYITSLGKERGTYIRTSGTSRHVDGTQLKELEFEGSNRYFDQTYCVGKTVTDDEIFPTNSKLAVCIKIKSKT